MSIDNNKKKGLSTEQIMSALFDDGKYTEISPSLESKDSMAEAVAAFGEVDGQIVYAFSQCEDRFGGAMSVAQANKLMKLYDLASKTGCPVVGFYRSVGGRVLEGNMLLDSLGELIALSSSVSGVVPQISVVLGECLSTNAVLAVNSDFVIMTEGSELSVGDECAKDYKRAAMNAADDSEAVEAVRTLLSYLPSNNLASAPCCEDFSEGIGNDLVSAFDADSELKLFENFGEKAETSFVRIMGQTIGLIKTNGGVLDCKDCNKIAGFVRFCDAFSIPVVTAVDAESFKCVNGARTLISAYSEATCPKISVIAGKAYGTVYLALAGKSSRADAVIALSGATVSPIKPEAAAYIALGDKLSIPVNEQDAIIKDYIRTELSAEKAAKAGYIDCVVSAAELRNTLVNYLVVLSGKREETLPKKHPTV